ncbi:hypothetical protein [Amycolatopsis sp. NPDC004625]|uniref:hypothetical protein n=1 Tax=Amycolatopsis sp. NPDC004625 TaxID=3154670 RepID=UPI0033A9CAAB
MDAIIFNLTTALLLILIAAAGLALVGRDTLPRRRLPWLAITLTALAVAGVVLQLCWTGAMDALDSDPAKSGWWRVITSVFMQNGGVSGAAWNIATLALVAALAEWFWGRPLTLALFLTGILLPQHIDTLLGLAAGPVDPRNFAGSSGATYFLGATLAAPLLIRTHIVKERLTATAVVRSAWRCGSFRRTATASSRSTGSPSAPSPGRWDTGGSTPTATSSGPPG